MIKNEIRIKGDWKEVEKLIDKLCFIMESHDALYKIRKELDDEDSVMHYRYTDLKLDQVDEYFANDANDTIIKYIINGEDE